SPATKLLLAGDGPCRGKLESLAGELGLSADGVFGGFVKDVESIYAALDVFLLPSFFEALNNSLLAAMAYEVPSIAFNRGALGEIIEHGRNGLLVEGADTPALCAAIARILRDSVAAKKMADAGRLRVAQNFSGQKMVDESLRLYASLARPA